MRTLTGLSVKHIPFLETVSLSVDGYAPLTPAAAAAASAADGTASAAMNGGLRKTRSAESVLYMQRPKIVVDGIWDEGDGGKGGGAEKRRKRKKKRKDRCVDYR